jgi:hypothetical protein
MLRTSWRKISTMTIFWWLLLLILTFNIRFYLVFLPNEEKMFGDSKAILACSNFKDTGFPWKCTDYLYGRFLRELLGQVTFLHSHTNVVIFITLSIFLLFVAHLLTTLQTFQQQVLGLVLFLSPAMALLVQRANLDILIFTLSWLAIRLFLRGRISLSLFIAFLASSFKIYPMALFLLLVGIALFKEVSAKAKIFWVLLTVFALWSALIDIRNIPWLPSDARNSFGLRIFGEYFTYLFSGSGYQMFPLFGIFLGVLIFIFIIAPIISAKFYSYFPKYEVSLESTIWLLYFLAIFASGISIDYRLLFLLPSLNLMTELNKQMRYVVTILFVLSFYLSYPFEILQVFGDIALFMLLSFNIVLLYKNRESFFRQTNLWRSSPS